MPFPDEVVGGIYLVRFAVRSPNYVPGVSGWTINQDGSAEFSDVVIRGGELLITDPDGSYIRIFDENPGSGAVINYRPADIPGHTVGEGHISTFSDVGPPASVVVQFSSPNIDSLGGGGYINLWLEATGAYYNEYVAQSNRFTGELWLGGKQLGFGVANIHMLTPPAPAGLTSATPITITGASTATFVKASANTRVEVFMSAGGYIAAGAGASVTFGILISGGIGDFSIVTGSFSALSNRIQFSGTRLLPAFAAGSYTITPRWFRSAGTSTIIMDAVDASLTVNVREVKEA